MTHKTYAYYPGCSLQHRSHAYEVSNNAIAKALGFELVEIDDWNCCGATEMFSLNRLPAYSLIARNLALAEEAGSEEVVAACSLCFLNLAKTDQHMKKFAKVEHEVNQALAAGKLHYDPGSVRVRHLLELVLTDYGLDAIKECTKRPLYGLSLAPYYGCLLARPNSVFDNTEQPIAMDRLIEALGAKAAPFSMKTYCCGGHMTQISEATALEMIHKIVKNAADGGADAIVTVCPMCQLNLDVYQGYANQLFETEFEIPVMFFSQLVGLAMGFAPKDLGFGQEFISFSPLLEKIQEIPPAKVKPERRSKQALPMPVMPE